ncbi:hypothetical protein PVAP13_6KG067735 [Panicum virgatum]|uniref:Uncharacterized protein n=1 Tax=Panicum virgatum TaxID=38727 RepID=A0A8T0R7W9_PANVG|nr:hypothetical protein PVAP13_6KG067735 [Panicum virgatum]
MTLGGKSDVMVMLNSKIEDRCSYIGKASSLSKYSRGQHEDDALQSTGARPREKAMEILPSIHRAPVVGRTSTRAALHHGCVWCGHDGIDPHLSCGRRHLVVMAGGIGSSESRCLWGGARRTAPCWLVNGGLGGGRPRGRRAVRPVAPAGGPDVPGFDAEAKPREGARRRQFSVPSRSAIWPWMDASFGLLVKGHVLLDGIL